LYLERFSHVHIGGPLLNQAEHPGGWKPRGKT
jgi:hypothetical protein